MWQEQVAPLRLDRRVRLRRPPPFVGALARGGSLAHRRRRRHGRGARRPRCVGPPRELRTPSSEAAAGQSCDQSSKARSGSESTILTSQQYGRVSNIDESTIFARYDSLLPMRTAPISIWTCSLEDSSSRCASFRIYMHDLLVYMHDLLAVRMIYCYGQSERRRPYMFACILYCKLSVVLST